MGIHSITSLCPLCGKITNMGHVDMTGQEMKYICPKCSTRHYGEPDITSDGYKCGDCDEETSQVEWMKIPMDSSEVIQGPLESCTECNEKLEDPEVIAFIEVEDDGAPGNRIRTGRLLFLKPGEEFVKNLKGERACCIENKVLNKMIKDNDL